MGTEKRERQKANRAARIEEAEAAEQTEHRRRRVALLGVVAVVLVGLVVTALVLTGGDDDAEVATGAGDTDAGPCQALATGGEGAPDLGLPTDERLDELQVEDLATGSGDAVEAGDTVTVSYVGFANSTDVQFDDSYSRGQPATFSLDQVIPGWSEGLVGMQPGSARILRIPADLAYGPTGSPPDIGPDEDLTFCVTLVSVEGSGDGTDGESAEAGPAVVPPPGPGATIDGETPCPPADGTAERTTSFAAAPPMCIDPATPYTAVFTTNKGVVRVELDGAAMPSTTNSFVVLARYGYYDDTAIFRTDTSIDILQGGAPTTNSPSDPGPGYTIPDEGGEFDFTSDPNGRGPFTYQPGQLVMARSQGPDASGAQFFFTAGPNSANLDQYGTYLVFGEVTEGLDVLQQILALHVPDPTGQMPGGGPSEPVVIESVTIEEA